ncbi:putative ribonuclease H-like domain-containing protein [Tanacetum coccineum]
MGSSKTIKDERSRLIDEEVYVMQPPGFEDPKFPDKVYRVEKAMYGIHQAPRAWYGTLSKYLLANGFQRDDNVADLLTKPFDVGRFQYLVVSIGMINLISSNEMDSHGEAFPIATSLDAGQDRENISKTSAMPHELSLRVTSLGGDEEVPDLEISQVKRPGQDFGGSQTTRGVCYKRMLQTGGNDGLKGRNLALKGKEITALTQESGEPSLFGSHCLLATASENDFHCCCYHYRPLLVTPIQEGQEASEGRAQNDEDELDRSNEESIQDFVPMDSKLESERFKRPGTLLEKERAKRLKTIKGSEQQSEGNKDVKEKDSDDHDKIINLQQWVVLVRQESSVDITPSVVKAPIYDWKIFKDKLREVYQIFRVGQAPKAYPYFEAMLKEFDRDDMVMFKPVATDGLWQFEAPINSWKLYKSCRVHCLIMEGMIIYMLDDVEYPLRKTTLQKMLDHKYNVTKEFKICYLGSTSGIRADEAVHKEGVDSVERANTTDEA